MLMHLHYEEIRRHQLDGKQLMPWDQLLDIQLLILQLHQIPTSKQHVQNSLKSKSKLTNGMSFMV